MSDSDEKVDERTSLVSITNNNLILLRKLNIKIRNARKDNLYEQHAEQLKVSFKNISLTWMNVFLGSSLVVSTDSWLLNNRTM